MSEAMRDTFGKKLAELGEKNKKIVVLDADVSSSSKSSYFAKSFPDRFFNCGVAEGNMVGVAAGLATAGFHPVVNAFAIFLALKSTDQIRHDFCYNSLPIVLAGAYGGLSDSFDGASHQSIADIAIMRALPNMEVVVPADSNQTAKALEYAFSKKTPVYIRLNRNALPDLPCQELNKEGMLLRKGKDITLAANGITVHAALEAATFLEKKGIDAEVFSVPFVKPFDPTAILKSLQKTGKLITIEEHTILAGFGSALLEKLVSKDIHFSYKAIGIQDTFGDTGPYDTLIKAYGLDGDGIATTVADFVRG